jgi:hypothetical protein
MLSKQRNTVTRFYRAIAALALLMLFSSAVAQAADYAINPTGNNFQLNNLVWGTSGANGFNNNYYFTPLYANGSVCVSVENNNPTSTHTFTILIQTTSDATENSPSDGTWQTNGAATGLLVPISPGTLAGLGANVSGAAQVNVNLSASSTQAGSPDTADVHIVQTQGNCASGSGFLGSATTTIAAANPLQSISETFNSAYTQANRLVNTTLGEVIGHVWLPITSPRILYYDRVTISTSVAAEFSVNLTSTAGSGCSVDAPTNIRLPSIGPTSLGDFNCATTQPNIIIALADVFIPANSSQTIDLKGTMATVANSGVDIVSTAAIAGTVTVNTFYYEK